jgi:hypothetical protein
MHGGRISLEKERQKEREREEGEEEYMVGRLHTG